MVGYKFSNNLNAEFSASLKTRVNDLFQEKQWGRNANGPMVIKSVMALSLYIIPFLVIMLAGITNVPILFLLWIMMGFGIAHIGTCVMHDSLHGSYSKRKSVNFIMGISARIIGVDPTVWKLQHNVLHHTYTNIEHADDDIEPRYVLRFSPHQPKRWFHRYQHIYVFFLYSISTLIWITAKDFIKITKYYNRGLIKSGKEYAYHLIKMIIWKGAYHTVFLVLPIMFLSIFHRSSCVDVCYTAYGGGANAELDFPAGSCDSDFRFH